MVNYYLLVSLELEGKEKQLRASESSVLFNQLHCVCTNVYYYVGNLEAGQAQTSFSRLLDVQK